MQQQQQQQHMSSAFGAKQMHQEATYEYAAMKHQQTQQAEALAMQQYSLMQVRTDLLMYYTNIPCTFLPMSVSCSAFVRN